MASTFRRSSKGSSSSKGGGTGKHVVFTKMKGTKPSTGGITTTSSGLRDLDQILGSSGQPLGTCLYLEQDRWTQSLAATLVKYWCAQAISHEQDLLIPVQQDLQQTEVDDENWNDSFPEDAERLGSSPRREMESLLQSLPRNLNIEKERRRQTTATTGNSSTSDTLSAPLESLQEEEEDEDDPDEDLKIAWQYKKDVQRERQGGVDGNVASQGETKGLLDATKDTFCHSFDLQGRLSEQLDIMQSCRIVDIAGKSSNGLEYFKRLVQVLPTTHDKVTRMMIYEPNALHLRVALPLLLSVIREKKLPIVLLVVVKPWRQDFASIVALRRTADVVLQAEGFASRKVYPPPPEFRMFQGLLRVPKAATVTASTAHGGGHFADLTTTKRPASDLYGLKRDRRKLHIQLLHIPPEDYAAGGGSVGGGGVRSGAGRTDKPAMGCASSGGTGPLDF